VGVAWLSSLSSPSALEKSSRPRPEVGPVKKRGEEEFRLWGMANEIVCGAVGWSLGRPTRPVHWAVMLIVRGEEWPSDVLGIELWSRLLATE
jgi:hypothetical protein